jgi:hypothetical protein
MSKSKKNGKKTNGNSNGSTEKAAWGAGKSKPATKTQVERARMAGVPLSQYRLLSVLVADGGSKTMTEKELSRKSGISMRYINWECWGGGPDHPRGNPGALVRMRYARREEGEQGYEYTATAAGIRAVEKAQTILEGPAPKKPKKKPVPAAATA